MNISKAFTKISLRILSIICLIFAIAIFLNLLRIENNANLLVSLILATSLLATVYGLWTLKKWALYIYLISVVTFQIYSLSTNSWTPILIMWPVIIISTILLNFKNLN